MVGIGIEVLWGICLGTVRIALGLCLSYAWFVLRLYANKIGVINNLQLGYYVINTLYTRYTNAIQMLYRYYIAQGRRTESVRKA